MILHDQHGAWSAMIWVDQVSADSSYPSHPSHPSQTSWMLVGGWPTPLKNMSSSVGIIIPNIWKKKCSKPPTRMSVSGFKFSWLFSPQLSDLGFSGGRPHLPSLSAGPGQSWAATMTELLSYTVFVKAIQIWPEQIWPWRFWWLSCQKKIEEIASYFLGSEILRVDVLEDLVAVHYISRVLAKQV